MRAIILVGGAGTRLRPVTYEIPKPLVPVKKKPVVNHLIELLGRHGVHDVGLLASRSHEDDFRRWQKAWGDELTETKITTFYEEAPRGTFGGMELAREWLANDSFVLTNGDELKDFDLTSLMDFHTLQGGVATIALVSVPNPHEYGVAMLEGDRIKSFLEKPNPAPSNFVNSGLYVMNPAVFDYADFSKEILMTEKDIFPRLASEGKLFGKKMEGSRWYDCGNLERWERAMQEW